jgi:phosphoribosyl-dephospho-CoA transferase
MQEIPKYINHQGKVAVIITNIPRAGWYTEHKIKEAVFDPDIVNAILMDEDSGVIEQIAVKKYGRENYTAANCLKVEWLAVNLDFTITRLWDQEIILVKKDHEWLRTDT